MNLSALCEGASGIGGYLHPLITATLPFIVMYLERIVIPCEVGIS